MGREQKAYVGICARASRVAPQQALCIGAAANTTPRKKKSSSLHLLRFSSGHRGLDVVAFALVVPGWHLQWLVRTLKAKKFSAGRFFLAPVLVIKFFCSGLRRDGSVARAPLL